MDPSQGVKASNLTFHGVSMPAAVGWASATFGGFGQQPDGPDLRQTCSPREYKQRIVSNGLADGAITVIFVRHGRSAGNERELIHKNSSLAPIYGNISNHELPLVDSGVAQARSAGRYLADMASRGLIPPIDRVLCSPFTRTQQTLEHLIEGVRSYCSEKQIPLTDVFERGGDAKAEQWIVVRERDWSDFETLDPEKKAEEYKSRVAHAFNWTPHGSRSGEPMADVSSRASSFMNAMHREKFKGKVVLVVTHGEFMNAVELVNKRLDPFSPDFKDSFRHGIPNCGIMMFSRVAFSPEMSVPVAKLGAFSRQLRGVPFELSEPDQAKFPDWLKADWTELKRATRTTVDGFKAAKPDERVVQLTQGIRKAGIGQERVQSKV